MDEGDEAAPSAGTRAIPTESLVVGEIGVGGNLRELALLQTGDKNAPALEKVPQLCSAVLDSIAVKLQEGTDRRLSRRAVREGDE